MRANMKWSLLPLFLSIVIGSFYAIQLCNAEETANETPLWTIDDCLLLAAENNLELQKGYIEIDEAQEEVNIRSADRYFKAELQASMRKTNEPDPITLPVPPPIPKVSISLTESEQYDLRLTLNQPIWTGGALANIYKAALQGVDVVEAKQHALCNIIQYQVKRAYFGVALTDALREVAELSKKQVEAHVANVQNVVKQGMALRNDLLKAKVYLSQSELAVQKTTTAQKQAKLALLYTMGMPLNTEFSITPSLEFKPVQFSIENLLNDAERQRSELQAINEQITMYHQIVRAKKGSLYPSVALTGSYGYGKPGMLPIGKEWNDYWVVGIGSQFTVCDWRKRASEIRKAELAIDKLSTEARRLQETIQAEVRKAVFAVEDAEQRVVLSEAETDQALEHFTLTQNLVKQGMATNTDFLDAETELTRARTNRVQAVIDYYSALVELERATGTCLINTSGEGVLICKR